MMRGWDFYPRYYHMGSFGFGIIPFILTILFWGLIIWVIVAIIRYISGGHEEKPEEPEAPQQNKYIEIIKERYAKGEINKREFEQMKKDLV